MGVCPPIFGLNYGAEFFFFFFYFCVPYFCGNLNCRGRRFLFLFKHAFLWIMYVNGSSDSISVGLTSDSLTFESKKSRKEWKILYRKILRMSERVTTNTFRDSTSVFLVRIHLKDRLKRNREFRSFLFLFLFSFFFCVGNDCRMLFLLGAKPGPKPPPGMACEAEKSRFCQTLQTQNTK